MDVGLLELEEGVPGDARLLQQALLVLLQNTAVHPKVEGAGVQVQDDSDGSLGGGEERLDDSAIPVELGRVAGDSKFYSEVRNQNRMASSILG